MRETSVGWWVALLGLGLAACEAAEVPGLPQPQAAERSRAPSSAGVDMQLPAATIRDAQASDARAPAPRDAAAPKRAVAPRDADAMSMPRDAGPAPALPDDDAGASQRVDASQAMDAGDAEPVGCSVEAPPPSAARCQTEGEVCAHWRTDPSTGYDAYFACNCIAASSNRLVWSCYENLSGSVQCPHEQPVDGSSCYGYRDRACPYPPRVTCACPLDASNLRWDCSEPASAPEAPASWPLSSAVRDLDDATRRGFCAWYFDARTEEGFPLPPEPAPTSDGYFPTSGCSGCGGGPGFGGMSPFPLPESACVASLELSTCEQPLSELIDCVRSMLNQCWPSPRGCARYLESPGCSGTLVVNVGTTQPIDCRIKVR